VALTQTEENRPHAAWGEAIHALALRQQTPEALMLDFSKWDYAPAEWITRWRAQASRTDIPLVLVLPNTICNQWELVLVNLQNTREAALEWMEKRLRAQ
jgi:hypothetical protein